MQLPVGTLFLHHTVTPVTNDPIHDARVVAGIGVQRFGRASYTVMVHPGRVIFWTQTEHLGVHTAGHNSTSLGLALIGDYSRDVVSDELVHDACVALSHLRRFGLLTATSQVLPHKAVKATACPGRNAVAKVLPMLRAVARDPDWAP